jgi:LysR family glycine cleavage system transcriptional activator
MAAARHCNLSRAAASLNITVSALSHQMTTLEGRLRMVLLVRGPRGVSLTAGGERLYREIATHYDALDRALRAPAARNETSLRIDSLPWFASSWLIPRLPAFVAAEPTIELSLSATFEIVDFDRNDQDAALRYGSGGWPHLKADLLYDEWVLPVVSPKLIARWPRRAQTDLSRWPLLADPVERWSQWFSRYEGSMPKRFVARFDSSETLVRGATEGLGVALAPETLVAPLLKTHRLARLGTRRLAAGHSYYLVYPARSAAHPPFQRFRDWLLRAVAADHPRA